jgi:hypothetical protein
VGHTAEFAPPAGHDVLRAPGQPLDAATRPAFDPQFGHDFSKVRVHAQAEAGSGGQSGPSILQRQGAGGGGAAAPPPSFDLKAIRVAFNTSGAVDAQNCAAVKAVALGVSAGGSASNGMELIYRIDGAIPAGTEFDILRTRTDTFWQRVGAAWTQIHHDGPGTNDDHTNDDECLTPTASKRIFSNDQPGIRGGRDPRGLDVFGDHVSAAATAFVAKFSFAEWVIARNRSLGVDFKVISTPAFTFWHSISSVAQNAAGTFDLVDAPSGQHNEIALGSIGVAGATP